MDYKTLEGKSLEDLVTKNTVLYGDEVRSRSLSKIESVRKVGTFTRFEIIEVNDPNTYFLIFEKGKLVVLFLVYEIHFIKLNKPRGFLLVQGHDKTHIYWFEDGYEEYETR